MSYVSVEIGQGQSVRWIVCKLLYEGDQAYAVPHPDDAQSLPDRLALIATRLTPLHLFHPGVRPHHFVHDGIVAVP